MLSPFRFLLTCADPGFLHSQLREQANLISCSYAVWADGQILDLNRGSMKDIFASETHSISREMS